MNFVVVISKMSTDAFLEYKRDADMLFKGMATSWRWASAMLHKQCMS